MASKGNACLDIRVSYLHATTDKLGNNYIATYTKTRTHGTQPNHTYVLPNMIVADAHADWC